MPEFLAKISFCDPTKEIKSANEVNLENDNVEISFRGDPIINEKLMSKVKNNDEITVKDIIHEVAGHFIFILLNKRKKTASVGNSLFSILSLYHKNTKDNITISTDPLLIANEKIVYNKRFILESVLFNYSLFDHSFIEGIKLLPCNSYLLVENEKVKIINHTKICDFFTSNGKSWKNEVSSISDLFIEEAGKYYPDEHYFNALTGGFDGRTLTATGLFYKNNFSCFTFGTSASSDVITAIEIAKKTNLNTLHIKLDKEYIEEHSFNNGLEFIQNCSGGATFARAHYLYASKELRSKTKYIVTGNFGSEIFRAAHNEGPVISSNLYKLFKSKDLGSAISEIENSKEFQYLNKNAFKDEWESLKTDLEELPCFNKEFKSLTKNQQFYKIIFEEVFRKYFGAEMQNQFKYGINRTPFLDVSFLKGILSTKLSGVHSDFFENNPLKRYKGQVLYAEIIRKAFPSFGNIKTNKGYKPDDLLSFAGKVRITNSFVKKKINKSVEMDNDPYSVHRSFESNKNFWKDLKPNRELFNKNILQKEINEKDLHTNSLFVALSQAWWNCKYSNV